MSASASKYSSWFQESRPQYLEESRALGDLDLVGLRQPAGAFPDPAFDAWHLQVIMGRPFNARFDLGSGCFSERLSAGQMVLSAPDTDCDYELDDDHEVILVSIPATKSIAALRESGVMIPRDFGQLHNMAWRDNAIRDLALKVWRASKKDALAPDVDPDAALIELTLALAKRADTGFTVKEQAWSLSPHAKNRVFEYIEAHIDQALPLFRLAEVAELSPFHFARSFRADVGDTPAQYVMRRRLSFAEEMIKKSDTSLADVAAASGFSSQPRMNEAFARHYGTSPGKIRSLARA